MGTFLNPEKVCSFLNVLVQVGKWDDFLAPWWMVTRG